LVAAHKYGQAIDLYSQAIELNGDNAVYWANRAFAHSKLEEYGSAIQDASKATEIDPKYSKAKHICLEFCFFLFWYPYLNLCFCSDGYLNFRVITGEVLLILPWANSKMLWRTSNKCVFCLGCVWTNYCPLLFC